MQNNPIFKSLKTELVKDCFYNVQHYFKDRDSSQYWICYDVIVQKYSSRYGLYIFLDFEVHMYELNDFQEVIKTLVQNYPKININRLLQDWKQNEEKQI